MLYFLKDVDRISLINEHLKELFPGNGGYVVEAIPDPMADLISAMEYLVFHSE